MVPHNQVKGRGPYVEQVKQSPPVNLDESYSPDWVAGKTILITGGASGFGEGFFRKWAAHGANIIIGDIADARGEALVAEVRQKTNNNNHHYLHCNVLDWQSQVDFFKHAVSLSPTRGIDAVIANAGIADAQPWQFENPIDLDTDAPPKPNFKVMEIDLLGVMYTAHLAYFWLPRNPRSSGIELNNTPTAERPDRHLLLLGSVASLMALPGQVQYNLSKHGVLGMFRALRGTSHMKGIRVNLLCPYFIETPILPAAARALLAGGAMGQPEDVVEAGTRFMADSRISGRALAIGPKLKVSKDDEWELVPTNDKNGKEMAIWECYADDYEKVDAFVGRFLTLLNTVEWTRGWAGWSVDMLKAAAYPLISKFR